MSNYFSQLTEAFYAEQKEASVRGDYEASVEWDTVVDLFDNFFKGVSPSEGMARFVAATETRPKDRLSDEVWNKAVEYMEIMLG